MLGVTLIVVAEPFTDRGDAVGPATAAIGAQLARDHGLTVNAVPADPVRIRAVLDVLDPAAPVPLIVASECSVALATLPWLAAQHPAARVLWLDAHGDFNTPQTSVSGYAPGMAVAAATGQWDAGVPGPVLPADRLVYAGTRDLDPPERDLLHAAGATIAPSLDAARAALGDAPVFVHLDADVVAGYPTAFPAPGGPSADAVRTLLAAVAAANPVVGITIASAAGPPEIPATIVEPLL